MVNNLISQRIHHSSSFTDQMAWLVEFVDTGVVCACWPNLAFCLPGWPSLHPLRAAFRHLQHLVRALSGVLL